MVTTEVKGAPWSFLPLVMIWNEVFSSGSPYHVHALKDAHARRVHDAQSCGGFMYFPDRQLVAVTFQVM